VTTVEVRGDKDVSVYLALADEDAAPGAVVGEAIRIVGQSVDGHRGSSLRKGNVAPGLTVHVSRSRDPESILSLSTVPFRIDSDHDLLENRDLFGLETATDASRGHFPRISPVPLAVQQAKQSAMAAFSAEGFEAAAVTAAGAMLGSAGWNDPLPHRSIQVTVTFDRPFAFVAVHRPSHLVLVAGWVADPQLADSDNALTTLLEDTIPEEGIPEEERDPELADIDYR
jgi:hypothetical protein